MTTTADRIRKLLRAGLTPVDIATRLETRAEYVRHVRSMDRRHKPKLRKRKPRPIEGPAHWYG